MFTKAEMRSARERLGQCSFILIAQKKLTYQHPKTLWISLDVKALNAVPLPSGMATVFPPVALSNALKHPAHKPEPPPTLDELLAPVDVDAALKG